MEETIFESPPKKRSNLSGHTESKTNLLSDSDSPPDNSMANGGISAEGYTNIDLDDERESEFELL